jgi:hypothetical protein
MARDRTGRRAFTVGSVLSRSLRIWGRNFVPFTLLAVLVYSPLLIYTYVTFREDPAVERVRTSRNRPLDVEADDAPALKDRPSPTPAATRARRERYYFVVGHATRLLDLILAGAVVYGVFQQLRGKAAPLTDCVRVGVARLLPVLGVALAVAVLVGLGSLALYIPGLLLTLMLWVAVPVAVVERQGVMGSLKRSNYLTSGEKGTIFLILLVLGSMHLAAFLLGGLAMVGTGRGFMDVFTDDTEPGLARALVPLLLVVPLGALSAVAAAVGYHDLRIAKEGVATEDLVSVFA